MIKLIEICCQKDVLQGYVVNCVSIRECRTVQYYILYDTTYLQIKPAHFSGSFKSNQFKSMYILLVFLAVFDTKCANWGNFFRLISEMWRRLFGKRNIVNFKIKKIPPIATTFIVEIYCIWYNFLTKVTRFNRDAL